MCPAAIAVRVFSSFYHFPSGTRHSIRDPAPSSWLGTSQIDQTSYVILFVSSLPVLGLLYFRLSYQLCGCVTNNTTARVPAGVPAFMWVGEGGAGIYVFLAQSVELWFSKPQATGSNPVEHKGQQRAQVHENAG